jgi:hypothetical protein
MANLLFKETQKFNQPLLWVILLSTYVPIHIWGVQELANKFAKGNTWWQSQAFLAALVALVLLNVLLVLFLLLKLQTRIDTSGIQFRYPPFINSWRNIAPAEIESIQVVKYSPWAYGGWGIRYSWHGWIYNIKGNRGIMIKKKNGKQLLIGTQNSHQAQEAIHQLMREERD